MSEVNHELLTSTRNIHKDIPQEDNKHQDQPERILTI
jgi:hypothetical protein